MENLYKLNHCAITLNHLVLFVPGQCGENHAAENKFRTAKGMKLTGHDDEDVVLAKTGCVEIH